MRRYLSALALAALAACATYPRSESVRPGDTPEQVRGRLGEPRAQRTLPNGQTAWYYATGPGGFETWRAVFAPNGGVTEWTQVLTAENFEWMRSGGVTRDAALDRVGPPKDRMSFAGTATEAWTYRWQYGTLEMIAEPVFSAKTGEVLYVGIFRDPAYSSQAGSQR